MHYSSNGAVFPSRSDTNRDKSGPPNCADFARRTGLIVINRVTEIFGDAHSLFSGSMERLDAGDIRDAAEKAWCATLRATNALILARTREEPQKTPATSRELKRLAAQDMAIHPLVERY